MLLALSIRDFVLIDKIDLSFQPGLGVMTGETGAGKSILLDALGLALGERGDTGLIRHGRDRAVVSAEFAITGYAGVAAVLADHGFEPGETLVLRRVLSRDGPSRAFLDDQPAGVALLRRVGESLAEIQDQHETHGLLAVANHRALIDTYGGLDSSRLAAVADAYDTRETARQRLADARDTAGRARAEEDYLRHVLDELEALAPETGEEDTLAEARELLRHGEQVAEAVAEALSALNADEGVEARLRLAERHLVRAARHGGGVLGAALEQVERAHIETAEAVDAVATVLGVLEADPRRLDEIEERLFGLRALARKHSCGVDDLPGVWRRTAKAVAHIDNSERELEALAAAADEAARAYDKLASALSQARIKAAVRLDKTVAKELAPLRLGKAEFRTGIASDSATGGRAGIDSVRFEATTNPGQPFAPLHRIASGGELTRFMLALKVVLAGGEGRTLVFDEADAGVGGATADAVGKRLAQLATSAQVLAVTHSPQVAARAAYHFRIFKAQGSNGAEEIAISVEELSPAERREEIARMLAGAEITDEARAAAERLMAHGGSAVEARS